MALARAATPSMVNFLKPSSKSNSATAPEDGLAKLKDLAGERMPPRIFRPQGMQKGSAKSVPVWELLGRSNVRVPEGRLGRIAGFIMTHRGA